MQTRSLPYARRDVESALPDYLSLRCRTLKRGDADPIAVELADRDFKLLDLAVHVDPALARDAQVVTRALGTSDFAPLFASALSRPVVVAYELAAAELKSFVFDMPVRSFRPVAIAQVDVGEVTEEVSESGELTHPAPVTKTTQSTAQLGAWGANLVVSRQAFMNDDAGVIEGLVRQVGQHCARLELRGLAELLDANDDLADASALFVGANDVTGGLSTAGLDNVSAALRQQVGGGDAYANNRMGALLVPPGKEWSARVIAAAAFNGRTGDGVFVAGNAWLGATYAYAFCDPPVAIARLILQGSSGAPATEQIRLPPSRDGIGVRVRHDFRIAAAQRVGVARITL